MRAHMNVCQSECDCCPWTDPDDGSEQHAADCHKQIECDDGQFCDKHLAEQEPAQVTAILLEALHKITRIAPLGVPTYPKVYEMIQEIARAALAKASL
jgi:hypothetical protein